MALEAMGPLRPDTACCRQLNWRTDLDPEDLFSPDGLEDEILQSGWCRRSRHAALKVFRHPEGHEIAWVVTTGRIQIRVDLAVPKAHRSDRAHQIFDRLGEWVQKSQSRGGIRTDSS